jgi:hypothetical protein
VRNFTGLYEALLSGPELPAVACVEESQRHAG